MKIIVIGSGFGGLFAAVRLQNLGHDVILIEKLDMTGGRGYVFKQDGYTFDAGPTVITAPWLIEELFTEAGKSPIDYLKFVEVNPFYRIYFNDGSFFNYNSNLESMKNEISKFNPLDSKGFEDFIKDTEEIFKTGFGLIDKPFLTLKSMLKVLPNLVKLRADKSVYKIVSKYIKNEKLRRVFSFHPLLVGGNPFNTTSIYTLILFLEKQWGVWFAMGGTGAVIKSIEKLFLELGGKLLLNSEVEKINIDEKTNKAKSVTLKNKSVLDCESVVSNADVAITYKNLIDKKFRKKYTDSKISKMDYSMSLFVLYFGTDKKYDDIPHHSIILGKGYKTLLNDIFNKKILGDDFSLYLHRPTATDSSLAPENCDSFYVLSPVPHLGSKTNWEIENKKYRDLIVKYLEDNYLPDLSKHIVTEKSIDPLYFQNVLNSNLGSAFSFAPTLMQSAWMRPHNQSEDVSNLYFVGAGTHPGAGLPGVISSAKIVANLIGKSK